LLDLLGRYRQIAAASHPGGHQLAHPATIELLQQTGYPPCCSSKPATAPLTPLLTTQQTTQLIKQAHVSSFHQNCFKMSSGSFLAK
jgi:hypothetical protein